MLSQERADLLTGLLDADYNRAENILALKPEEALQQINALGYDFTLDEINGYGKAVEEMAIAKGYVTNEELSEDQLGEVTGGQNFKVMRPSVPIFDRMPGGAFSRPPRVLGTLNQGTVVQGSVIGRDKHGNHWVRLWGSSMLVNLTHLLPVR